VISVVLKFLGSFGCLNFLWSCFAIRAAVAIRAAASISNIVVCGISGFAGWGVGFMVCCCVGELDEDKLGVGLGEIEGVGLDVGVDAGV
jgi:hypothetical protein